MKELFDNTPGFGDVLFDKYGRYPSIETLERRDIRPGNVKQLQADTGVNPISHAIRVNYSEMRRILVEIDKNFSTILPVDGVTWLMSTLCDELDAGITKNLIM